MGEAWIERWQDGRTGWHEEAGNAGLKRHWRSSGRRVLVPMCGKAYDMKWLADQGNEVIGVELSALAIEAFFAEHTLDYTVDEGDVKVYQSADRLISIICGDFFNVRDLHCDAHFDRGALIAMPAELRAAYARHVLSLLADDAEQLVITVEYDQSIADGPPFSVEAEELLGHWPNLVCVDTCDDVENMPPKFVAAGLPEMIEKVWLSS